MDDAFDPSSPAVAEAAFRQAAAKLIRRAKQAGTPLILWQDGEVRSVPPEELPVGPEDAGDRRIAGGPEE